jgi:hypothetical protein
MAAGGISSALGETGRDNVGQVINRTLRNAGGFFGQDWGVDDSKMIAQQAAAALPGASKTYSTGPNQTAAAADRTGLRLDTRTQFNGFDDPRSSMFVTPGSASAPGAAQPPGAAQSPAAAPAQPQFGQPYSSLRAGTPEYAAAAKMIDDSDVYVPRGTGAMRNNSTGKITSFDSRSYAPEPGPTQDQLRRAYAPTQYAQPAAAAAPALREKPTSWVDEMRQRKDDRLEADRVLSRRNIDATNATSRFNNSETNATSRLNNENTNETTTYGNELTSNSNRNRLRYDAMVGERKYRDERYDKGLEQGRAANQDAAADFKGLFSTTKADGSVMDRPDMEARAKLIVDRATNGGYSRMSSTERTKYRNDAVSYVSILESAKKNQNNTWMQAAGLSAADTPFGGLPPPEELSKAKLEVVGFVEGKMTPGTSAGARVLRFPGSNPIYLDNLSGEHLKFLKDNGVQIGATK